MWLSILEAQIQVSLEESAHRKLLTGHRQQLSYRDSLQQPTIKDNHHQRHITNQDKAVQAPLCKMGPLTEDQAQLGKEHLQYQEEKWVKEESWTSEPEKV